MGRFAQGQNDLEAGQQTREFLSCLPYGQQQRVESILKLVVAANRKISVTDAQAGSPEC